MNKVLIFLISALWMTSCTKQSLSNHDRHTPQSISELVGKWILIETGAFNASMHIDRWQAVHSSPPVEIEIGPDSSFAASANYPWAPHYNCIRRHDTALFLEWAAPGPAQWYPTTVWLTSDGDLILTENGVDTSESLLFKRVQ